MLLKKDPKQFSHLALSRAVFTVTQQNALGKGHVVLSCAKVKGRRFDDASLRLDETTRWFRLEAQAVPKLSPPDMDEVVSFLRRNGEAATSDVYEH